VGPANRYFLAMMGHKGKLKGGFEWDVITGWRRYMHWKPGTCKYVKRKYNKRMRRLAREKIYKERTQ
jgi:hypothetical protein